MCFLFPPQLDSCGGSKAVLLKAISPPFLCLRMCVAGWLTACLPSCPSILSLFPAFSASLCTFVCVSFCLTLAFHVSPDLFLLSLLLSLSIVSPSVLLPVSASLYLNVFLSVSYHLPFLALTFSVHLSLNLCALSLSPPAP